jgi:hypothetical protein
MKRRADGGSRYSCVVAKGLPIQGEVLRSEGATKLTAPRGITKPLPVRQELTSSALYSRAYTRVTVSPHSRRAPWRVAGHGRKRHRELKAEIESSDLWVMNWGS